MRIFLLFFLIFLSSCADYKTVKKDKEATREYYTSTGFVLIFDETLYQNKVVNKKIDNTNLHVLHSFLKINTPIKIINPENLKSVEAKIIKNGQFPKIFNAVISEKIVSLLELDINNPYVEIIEMKKNKKFIAKESNTFDEEKNVAESAPVDKIEMDDLSSNQTKKEVKKRKTYTYDLIVADFFYEISAYNLKKELTKEIKNDKFFVKKINNNKYRLGIGPFKNFNALKSTYISLNNLGFENLNIKRK